jgi:hypothetical protein
MKRFLLFFCLITPFLAAAQSNYRAGYVLTNAGDSIPGFINYKEREQNPAAVEFRTAANGPSQTYRIVDCKGYGINGIISYERFPVSVSLGKVDINNLSYALDTTSIRDTVLLQVVQKGKNLSLYSYSDQIKTRFYVKEPSSSEPVELIYATYFVTEGGQTVSYDKYVRQLNALMVKNNIFTGTNQSKLKSLKYNKAYILGIVSQINDQNPQQQQRVKAARFFVGAGLNSTKATYSGSSVFNGPGVTAKTSYSPTISAGIDLFSNPNIGRIIYRAELSLTQAKSDIYAPNTDPTIEYKDHSFDSYTLSIMPQLIWNLYNTNPLKVFIGAGAAFNVSSYQDNVTVTKSKYSAEPRIEKDKTELSSFYLAPQLSAGMVLRKRIELSGNYQFSSAISDYSNFNVCMVRMNFGIKYLF